jgi:hypothetical protein
MWPSDGEAMIEEYERALVGAPEDPGLRRAPTGRRRPVALSPTTLSSMLAGAFVAGALVGWAVTSLRSPRRG